ncbi:hypothetical protein BDR04DRAFT_1137935 [Suillus decipiens]|nr:hypothetical protein BDR04DRAFT_1137935 [Suillus decipiens]
MSELPLREVHSPINSPRKTLIVPLKMHLVALLAQTQGSKLSRFIDDGECAESNENKSEDKDDKTDEFTEEESKITAQSSLLPGASIFRPHGSLPTPIRLASLRDFSAITSSKSKKPAPASSILLCTSVASRGLDLPLVRAVIQHNLAAEGGVTEYVHRVGRTARAGKDGEAWSIVSLSESEWVKWMERKMRGDVGRNARRRQSASTESVLAKGVGGKGSAYEARATEVQLSLRTLNLLRERMRAYATHPSNEKHIFRVRHLHIGHLAKAFTLHEAPKTITDGMTEFGIY